MLTDVISVEEEGVDALVPWCKCVVVKIMVPFLGYPKYYVPYYNRDPKRDHNFDKPPNVKVKILVLRVQGMEEWNMDTTACFRI